MRERLNSELIIDNVGGRDLLISTISTILKRYDFIDFALLFGSYANGKSYHISDIDIAVYLSKEVDIFELGYIIAELEESFHKKIDFVVLNGLHKKNPKLCYNIYANHKIIFIDNKEAYEIFKLDSLREYEDMRYIYDMFEKDMRERLKIA